MNYDRHYNNSHLPQSTLPLESYRNYTFYMPRRNWGRVIVAFIIVCSPGAVILLFGPPYFLAPNSILALAILAVGLVGISSRFFTNKVIIGMEKMTVINDFQKFYVTYPDIEYVFIAQSEEEIDAIVLPENHVPMEFDHGGEVIVIVFRDRTKSKSSAIVHDNLYVKYLTFNLFRQERFLAYLRPLY